MTRQDIEEVLPGVYKIPVPLEGNPLKELNSYLFAPDKEKGKAMLVDTGFRRESCKSAILEALSILGISRGNMDILLTHLHADHSGNAPDLLEEGNRIYISATDMRYLTSIEEAVKTGINQKGVERFSENGVPKELIAAMYECTPSRVMMPDDRFKSYTSIEDGQVLRAGGYDLKAVSVPGHTPGQMCFEVEGTGAMVLGDHVLFDITPNITDWAGVKDSLGDYLESLDKIDKYDVKLPLPGHRKPGDFHQRIAVLKRHHAKRLEECLEVIRSLGHGRLYDIAGNMTWKIRADSWDTFPDAQRWFALGECLSHIDHLKLAGKIAQHGEDGAIWYEAY